MDLGVQVFAKFPSSKMLHWLSHGQLKTSFSRTVRFWVILSHLYSLRSNWSKVLPSIWRYPDLRDQLFAQGHPQSDESKASHISDCTDSSCICHQSTKNWLNPTSDWCEETCLLSGLTSAELTHLLEQRPFATVHRSIRADLKMLSQQGWLQELKQGQYSCVLPQKLPQPPQNLELTSDRLSFIDTLSTQQTIELWRALETLSQFQPSLEFLLEPLSLQVLNLTNQSQIEQKHVQRVFIHFDYILPPAEQEQVDARQQDIEDLWQKPEGGVILFDYWYDSVQKVRVVVYPVCLHYVRRAKYLSAYGKDPEGNIGWHNYRLDRIASAQLKVLAWGDRSVPKELKDMRRTGKLPTPEYVEAELEKAWGFKFYSKPELLILRFPSQFARWYVDRTQRHHTFKPIPYQKLGDLIHREITDLAECEHLLEIVKQRSPNDAYYQAQIRPDDINIIQRLRDWRPNGEVIAPLSLRQLMADEAQKELIHYESI